MIISVYLKPLIYKNSEILNGTLFDANVYKKGPWNDTSVMLNSTVGDGEELENPLESEFDSFAEECKWLVKEAGFTFAETERATETDRILYSISFYKGEAQCGSILFEIKISENPFDESFPENYKAIILEHITPEKLLDGTTKDVGIDFQVEKVVVENMEKNSWYQALDGIYDCLKLKEDWNEN